MNEALNFKGEGTIRADVNGEVKFFVKIQKKKKMGGGGEGEGLEGGGVMVDVNREVKFW